MNLSVPLIIVFLLSSVNNCYAIGTDGNVTSRAKVYSKLVSKLNQQFNVERGVALLKERYKSEEDHREIDKYVNPLYKQLKKSDLRFTLGRNNTITMHYRDRKQLDISSIDTKLKTVLINGKKLSLAHEKFSKLYLEFSLALNSKSYSLMDIFFQKANAGAAGGIAALMVVYFSYTIYKESEMKDFLDELSSKLKKIKEKCATGDHENTLKRLKYLEGEKLINIQSAKDFLGKDCSERDVQYKGQEIGPYFKARFMVGCKHLDAIVRCLWPNLPKKPSLQRRRRLKSEGDGVK